MAAMTTVIFDMDGVIYRGSETLPGVVDCIRNLRDHLIKTGFLTNNSVRSREDYIERLRRYGIDSEIHEIMTSGEATARYLISLGYNGQRIYVIGGKGLATTLTASGFEVDTLDEGNPCDFVIIGWDREISFNKIARAQHEILVNGAKLIATNADAMFPTQGGRLLPGAGSMVAAVERASGTSAEIIGKPRDLSLRYLLDELGSGSDDPSSVWVVGDRLDTDITCGNSHGAVTVLVTTGIASRKDGEQADGMLRPDHIIDKIAELPDLITEADK